MLICLAFSTLVGCTKSFYTDMTHLQNHYFFHFSSTSLQVPAVRASGELMITRGLATRRGVVEPSVRSTTRRANLFRPSTDTSTDASLESTSSNNSMVPWFFLKAS